MTKRIELPRRALLIGTALIGALLVGALLLTSREDPPARGQPAAASWSSGAAPLATAQEVRTTLDPAAQAEVDRLSRLSHAELVVVAQAPSGFSRLLAMNILGAPDASGCTGVRA